MDLNLPKFFVLFVLESLELSNCIDEDCKYNLVAALAYLEYKNIIWLLHLLILKYKNIILLLHIVTEHVLFFWWGILHFLIYS